jgi:hypothetical protein
MSTAGSSDAGPCDLRIRVSGSGCRDPGVVGIGDDLGQLLDTLALDRCNDPFG